MRSIEDMLDEIENANQGAGPDPHTTFEGARLKAITEAVSQRDQAEDAIEAAVAQARHDGASWTMIGSALGISRQDALKRYGELIPA
ncbi:MAG: hypothetical protein FWF43_04475 [Propionibacteriaceae bacterium]|nr:hypothetical protein [Propionibacteriaceae bacterium]